MEKKTRIVVGASCFAIAIVGTVYGGWALLDAIFHADSLTKFLIGSGGAGAGGFASYVAAKRGD